MSQRLVSKRIGYLDGLPCYTTVVIAGGASGVGTGTDVRPMRLVGFQDNSPVYAFNDVLYCGIKPEILGPFFQIEILDPPEFVDVQLGWRHLARFVGYTSGSESGIRVYAVAGPEKAPGTKHGFGATMFQMIGVGGFAPVGHNAILERFKLSGEP